MIGMQFVVQNFTDGGVRIFPGMFAKGAMVADGGPYFFEGPDFFLCHFRYLFPNLFVQKASRQNELMDRNGFFLFTHFFGQEYKDFFMFNTFRKKVMKPDSPSALFLF